MTGTGPARAVLCARGAQSTGEILAPIMQIEHQRIGHPPEMIVIENLAGLSVVSQLDLMGDLSRFGVKPGVNTLHHLEFLHRRAARLLLPFQLSQPLAKRTLRIVCNLCGRLVENPMIDALVKRATPVPMGTNCIANLCLASARCYSHVTPSPMH